MIHFELSAEIMFFAGVLIGVIIGFAWGFDRAYKRFDSIVTKTFENIKKAKNGENI